MRLNVYFKCAQCRGAGWITPNTPCHVCKGKGEVLHRFKDVLRIKEFPDITETEVLTEHTEAV